nr:ATP-dependent Clp protease proteolytic subunit [Corydalis pauciovulata]
MPVGVPKVPVLSLQERLEKEKKENNRLHQERCLFLFQKLQYEITNNLLGLLITLNIQDPTRTFWMFVNSRGGSAICAMTLSSQILRVQCHTVNTSKAYSVASLVVSAGKSGDRIAFPHSVVVLHEPSTNYIGPDGRQMYLAADEFKTVVHNIIRLYAKKTHQTEKCIYEDMRLGASMTSGEAKNHGIVDRIGMNDDDIIGKNNDSTSPTSPSPNDEMETFIFSSKDYAILG